MNVMSLFPISHKYLTLLRKDECPEQASLAKTRVRKTCSLLLYFEFLKWLIYRQREMTKFTRKSLMTKSEKMLVTVTVKTIQTRWKN